MNFVPNKALLAKWIQNQIVFLKPLFIFIAILYVGFLIPRIQDNGISLSDFAPTNAVITAGALYIFNSVYDYLRKLNQSN